VAVSPYERDRSFRENEIDGAVLPRLTHENLKELGVTALGHRLKLLDAIAALRGDATSTFNRELDRIYGFERAVELGHAVKFQKDRHERLQVAARRASSAAAVFLAQERAG